MEWSVESLLSYPAARVRFPPDSEILICILGLGVSFVFCLVLSLTIALNCADHTFREAPVVYLSSVLVHSLLLLLQGFSPTGIWVVSPGRCKSYIVQG